MDPRASDSTPKREGKDPTYEPTVETRFVGPSGGPGPPGVGQTVPIGPVGLPYGLEPPGTVVG